MSLYDTKYDCQLNAAKLPMRYEKYDINVLADGYCKALDEDNKEDMNIYLSALLLRFWNKIDKMYQACKGFGFEREDAFIKLYECIDAACHYRAWQDPEKNTNAQACINQVIAGRGIPAIMYEARLQKNYRPECTLDNPIDGEEGDTFGDTIASDETVDLDPARDMIQMLIKSNKLVEAIIADTIAYNDTFKYTKETKKLIIDDEEVKYTETTAEFWAFKLVQMLNTIDDAYIKYFTKTYTVNIDRLKRAIDALKNANNQKKYKMISAFQDYAKTVFA